jgi:hypothetical protein
MSSPSFFLQTNIGGYTAGGPLLANLCLDLTADYADTADKRRNRAGAIISVAFFIRVIRTAITKNRACLQGFFGL